MLEKNKFEANRNRVLKAISSTKESMSLEEYIDKAREMRVFLEKADQYIQRSNLIIKDLNHVLNLLEEHEEEMKKHADEYITLITHKPQKIKEHIKRRVEVNCCKKYMKELEEAYLLILAERYDLNNELYKVNESFLKIESLEEKIEVLRQIDLETANKLIIKLNHAKEENQVLLTLNKTLKERIG